MPAATPQNISQKIWEEKYRFIRDAGESNSKDALLRDDLSIEDTWNRVARAAAGVEVASAGEAPEAARQKWRERFFDAMRNFEFLPAGRILAGAGTGRSGVTLFNCFVMNNIEDSLDSIMENVKEAAITLRQGGGIGHDFSTLRPRGAPIKSIGAESSGPVSFMDVWDATCKTIMSAGRRRGAMMATMRCDHPDIKEFIDSKSDPNRLRNFNLSVLVTDSFVSAVRDDLEWALRFGDKVYETIPARSLWDRLMRATYEYAEPGVIFIDRINKANNLSYCESIFATNPCGEEPLPPYGACLLGSINLAKLVRNPFTTKADLDERRLRLLTETAVRFLDNIIDVSTYPLLAQEQEAKSKRRIGLGVTGLADALIFCGIRYGTEEAIASAERWMSIIRTNAYRTSAELAKEKGPFPLFSSRKFLATPNVKSLPDKLQAVIASNGMRNGLVTSIAPTGTISLLAGNVSGGIEPVYRFRVDRQMRERDGSFHPVTVEDYAYAQFRKQEGARAALTKAFVTAEELSPQAHLEMQAAMQRHVDASISKTINCPVEIGFDAFKDIYLKADALGLKGCTTFRPNEVTGAILTPARESLEEELQPDREGQVSQTAPVSFPHTHSGIVYMPQPLEREGPLSGFTYKLRWPGSDHAMYITINDIERDERRRPFEIFINSKNLEHYAWTVALTRMISAIFRRGGDVAFVVEELKAVFDPQGGHWSGGRYVPSLLAAIGEVIERHMLRTGFIVERRDEQVRQNVPDIAVASNSTLGSSQRSRGAPQVCPRCNSSSLRHQEGCWTCNSCLHSDCD